MNVLQKGRKEFEQNLYVNFLNANLCQNLLKSLSIFEYVIIGGAKIICCENCLIKFK